MSGSAICLISIVPSADATAPRRQRSGNPRNEAICLAADRDIRCSMPAPPARGGTSVAGTKHNCLGAHGISGAEGRPAVPSRAKKADLDPYATLLMSRMRRRRELNARTSQGHLYGAVRYSQYPLLNIVLALEQSRPPRCPAVTQPRARQARQHLGAEIRQLVEIIYKRDRDSPEPQRGQPLHLSRY
jgi:hypothetical protein